MRKVAIIQARMGSSRLPGKILALLGDTPVLQHVIERVSDANVFDEIAVATTSAAIDDPTQEVAVQCGATVIRGDEKDVLSRYGLAAEKTRADVIMRITADCPLIDPDVMQAMMETYISSNADLVTNARKRTFPRGLDAELFDRFALDAMIAEAGQDWQREHVTPFLYEHPERFKIIDHVDNADNSGIRLTLDTPDDLRLLQLIFHSVPCPRRLRLKDVLEILTLNPEWQNINAHIEQKKAN